MNKRARCERGQNHTASCTTSRHWPSCQESPLFERGCTPSSPSYFALSTLALAPRHLTGPARRVPASGCLQSLQQMCLRRCPFPYTSLGEFAGGSSEKLISLRLKMVIVGKKLSRRDSRELRVPGTKIHAEHRRQGQTGRRVPGTPRPLFRANQWILLRSGQPCPGCGAQRTGHLRTGGLPTPHTTAPVPLTAPRPSPLQPLSPLWLHSWRRRD